MASRPVLGLLLGLCAVACAPSQPLTPPAPAQNAGPATALAPLPADMVAANRPIPEYLRCLDEVFFLDSGRHDPNLIVGPLAAAMPAYTAFNLITPRPEATPPAFGQGHPFTLLPDALPKNHRATSQFWAQDTFHVLARPDGSKTLLLPRGESFTPQVERQLQDMGYQVVGSRLGWEGGNLATDFFEGRSLLFLGYTLYEGQSERADNPGLALQEVQTILAAEFEADVVVPVPYVTGNLFHLDQIFMITGPGQVVVHNVDLDGVAAKIQGYIAEPGNYFFRAFAESNAAAGCAAPAEDLDSAAACVALYAQHLAAVTEHAQQHAVKMHDRLDEVATLFTDLGYQVHRLEVDVRLLWDHLSLVNGIPYQDRQSGQPAVILPEYLHHGRAQFADMQRAQALFTALGRQVIFAPMGTAAGGGGPHCVCNVAR